MRAILLGLLAFTSVALAQTPEPIKIADNDSIPWKQRHGFKVTIPQVPAGYHALLRFLGRIQFDQPAGSAHMVRAYFNGTLLGRERLANKDNELTMANDTIGHWYDGSAWRLLYSPDFIQCDGPSDTPCAILTGKAYEFMLDVTDLVKPGENDLWLDHAWEAQFPDVVLKDVAIVFRQPGELYTKPGLKPQAPTGPLPMIAPRPVKPLQLRAFLSPGGGITVSAGEQMYHLSSDFTYPGGGHNTMTCGHDPTSGHATWTTNLLDDTHARGRCQFYEVKRGVKAGPACVEVSDTITNLTDQDLGLIIQHTYSFSPAERTEYRLGGLKPALSAAREGRGGNPTSFVGLGDHSLGLLPRDDVFRVHCLNFYEKGKIGLEEHYFALPPKGSYTLRWSIFPGPTGSYWDFINSARRVLDVNFALDGCFGFSHWALSMKDITPAAAGEWCRNRSLKYVSNVNPSDLGVYVQGTHNFMPQVRPQLEKVRDINNTIKQGCPGVKSLMYYHCYISSEPGAAAQYQDSIAHDENGKQLDYNDPRYPIFVPTLTNSYGRAMEKLRSLLLDDLKFDGLYWDEFSYSKSQYLYDWPEWDGHTALLDPANFTIAKKISFQTLVSQPFRLDMAKRLLADGHPLIANGEPLTETEMRVHFPRFVETGGPAAMNETHLFSPVGLSDSMTEQQPADFAANMRRHLDYGCVYYYYFFSPPMPHPMLTEYMYPITPLELHEGYLIGKERILTNRAGVFGWRDRSQHEVHVFNEQGDPVQLAAPTVTKNGATWTELRLPQGYTAAIVRR
jgi:hypothetical protein